MFGEGVRRENLKRLMLRISVIDCLRDGSSAVFLRIEQVAQGFAIRLFQVLRPPSAGATSGQWG
jgi:hypothetical protein